MPEYVKARQRDFRSCRGCGRIYWPGTHCERIEERLKTDGDIVSRRLMQLRLDAHGRVVSTQHLQVWEFLEHSLVEAQAAGQLFTPPVRRHG